jgi:threonine dehydratase
MNEAGAAVRLRPDEVERAAAVVGSYLAPTPLRRSFAVEDRADVWLKLECWQPTGSFKVREVDKLRRFPIAVREEGRDYDEAAAHARAYVEQTGAREVHAFEDRATAAGQGTAALEVLGQLPDVGTLVVPVGGGGLIAGCAVAVKARSPRVRIVAVQPAASPALSESLRLGRPLLEFPAAPTIADGVAGGTGLIAYEHRDLFDAVVDVPEHAIEDAVVALLTHDQVVAEGSGALGVAALRCGLIEAEGGPVAVVVTGGNIDARVLSRLLAART